MTIFTLAFFMTSALAIFTAMALTLYWAAKQRLIDNDAFQRLSGVASVVGGVASILGVAVAIIVYFLPSIMPPSQSTPTATSLDCSLTIELGPWPSPTDVIVNPNRDGWVQADFWSPSGPLVSGYDEVSVIFEPSLRATVSGVAGISWKYDRSWSLEDVEQCTNKHVEDSWNIRHKRLIIITPAELCSIVRCY